jgi:tetratricopeptide (TPR) repeat protein
MPNVVPGYTKTALNTYGDLMLTKGRPDEALEAYQASLRYEPDNNPHAEIALHVTAAEELIAKGQLEKALGCLDEAAATQPEHRMSARALLTAGVLLVRLDRPQEAIKRFQSSIAIDPYVADSHALLGSCFARLGRVPEAIESLRRANQLDPQREDVAMALEELHGLTRESEQLGPSGGALPAGE